MILAPGALTDMGKWYSAQMGLKLSGKKASGYVHQLVMLAANTMDGFIPWCGCASSTRWASK